MKDELNQAAGLLDELENQIVKHHAKMVEEYCKSKKCSNCTFYSGVCSLAYFLPSNWNIKEVEEKG